jgi:hypothetical protein
MWKRKQSEIDWFHSVDFRKNKNMFLTTTVKIILTEWLKEYNYDGLAGDHCGCGINDLCPCDCNLLNCQPAYKIKTDCKNCKTPCDGEIYNNNSSDAYCYKTEKPK